MIEELINDLMLKIGETKRFDCPFCGGVNTFTITKERDSTVWNCYKASCPAKGGIGTKLSRADLAHRKQQPKPPPPFVIPSSFTLDFPVRMVRYLEKNNVLDAWKANRVQLYYDVAANRVVFIIKADNKPVDAVGRALHKGVKWLRYGTSKEPFIVPTDIHHAIVVEDAASAAAVSQYGTGIALLGTQLTDRALEIISQYRSVTVALDRDATNKALHLTKRIKQFTTATMKILKEDPKVYPRGVVE